LPGLARRLFRDVAVFGVGDVLTSAISFLLIPLYTRVLTPTDYGVLGLLLTIEAGAKIVLRWGVDAAFVRLSYDDKDPEARQTLASSIWIFVFLANAPIFGVAYVAAPWLGEQMFATSAHTATLRAFLLNTFITGFFFVPFQVYRIDGQTGRFAALTFLRAIGTLVLRLWFVIGLDMGVYGMVLADLVLTAFVGVLLLPTVIALFRPRCSLAVVWEALRYGLPRVPHGIAHQATALSDRWILNAYLNTDRVGIYAMGVSFGQAIKLFLSAFEYAWAPFYFEVMTHPEAKALYRRVTTVVTALLLLMATGLAAVADDVLRVMTQPAFYEAAAVVPWVALGVAFQGFYQLTAIGLTITKRTALMPIATAAAMSVAIGVNLVLVPRFGIVAAAWTYALAYATLAVVGFSLSQRVYPIEYDWSKFTAIVFSAVSAYGLARWSRTVVATPILRLAVASAVLCCTYGALLWFSGVVRPSELLSLVKARGALKRGETPASGEEIEIGGEIAGAPSVIDQASLSGPPKQEG